MNDAGEFIQLLTSHQSRLYAYILSLVFDRNEADDVLQQTNVVLWRSADEFQLGTNFVAWSFRIAYYQVLAHRKQKTREKLIFDDEMLSGLAQIATESDQTYQARQQLVRSCIEKLNERQRTAVERRYRRGATLETIAEETARTVNAVKQTLFRARENLIRCVHKGLSENA
ncbi:sigma-70 family RNA polymerase sigma factor [Blastopirellula marina]|uniref:RNA polymerase subunit sigma-70 n=1 Tax=Blastopirellula marina TaxID=124 RepID=A0A2S8F2V1_9BACT|nr:sigma-70 family RNA polymerase sigma factor [Blastopirellula marina]PQO26491.1 RNA polymerase subunit sigma-70 [Blastopirellula marina]PTL40804.1 RNA polymerase subunit sigma-70 [Blastopirellula marina]